MLKRIEAVSVGDDLPDWDTENKVELHVTMPFLVQDVSTIIIPERRLKMLRIDEVSEIKRLYMVLNLKPNRPRKDPTPTELNMIAYDVISDVIRYEIETGRLKFNRVRYTKPKRL